MDTGDPSLDLKEDNEREEHSRVSLSSNTLDSDNEDEKEDHSHHNQYKELYTPAEERAVVKKFDRRLVLFVALLYMLSFLDRSSKSLPHLPYGKFS